MSTADERLDSHETRISNLETERGDHSRALIEHSSEIAQLKQVTKTLGDGVSRATATANRALQGLDEMKDSHAVLERALMRAVDKAVSGTAEHLKKQDDVLAKQNEVLGRVDAGLSRLVKKADDDDIVAAADRRRAERILWWAKAIAIVAGAAGVVIGAARFLFLKG